MLLSIIIPARNEEKNIGNTLKSIVRVFDRNELSFEIIVVDDGSTDGTVAEVERMMTDDERIRLVQNQGEHGYGLAVRCALDVYAGDAVAIVMADCSDSPDDIIQYYHILKDRAECAFGSRFIKGSKLIDYPWFKLFVNRIANFVIKVLFRIPYNDVTNAFKGYRSEVIEGCRPFLSHHFNLTVEMPLKAIVRGYTYEVIPISWTNRSVGVSNFKIKEMGSRYTFILFYAFLEKLLVRKDYQRRREVTRPYRNADVDLSKESRVDLLGQYAGLSHRRRP